MQGQGQAPIRAGYCFSLATLDQRSELPSKEKRVILRGWRPPGTHGSWEVGELRWLPAAATRPRLNVSTPPLLFCAYGLLSAGSTLPAASRAPLRFAPWESAMCQLQYHCL